MAEIYRYSNDPIRTKIFYAGNIVDADGNVSVTIYDVTEDPAVLPPIDPGTVIGEFYATKDETDIGSYYITLPFDYTDRNRTFKLLWQYQVEGIDIQHFTTCDVITPYVNIADVMEELELGSDPSDPNHITYKKLVAAEKYARTVIDQFCGQSFYLYDDVQVAYGAGTEILPLSFKLNALHELYANDYLLVDNINSINNWGRQVMLTESGFGIRVDQQNGMDDMVYIANGMTVPTIYDQGHHGSFSKGIRYRVQGKFGWDEVPEAVEQACTILIGDYLSKDVEWKNRYIKSISSFDWQFEFNDSAYQGTGNAYADKLLYPYVITGMFVV